MSAEKYPPFSKWRLLFVYVYSYNTASTNTLNITDNINIISEFTLQIPL